MKTLKAKTIDGIEIIDGVGKLSIDGVETRKHCKPMIDALPESEQMRIKADDGMAKLQQAAIEKKKAKAFAKQGEQSQSNIHATKAEKLYHAADVINDEMKEIKKLLAPKQRDILRGNPNFHEPGRGLLKKLDGETWPTYLARIQPLEDAYFAKGENEQVKTDGTIIPDFRGSKYSKKISGTWGFGTITGLDVGLPTGAKWDEDLTEPEKTEIAGQNENERLEALSPEEKAAEYNTKVAALANEAQAMENELKFSGDPDFVAKAQDFYDAEILILNTKYGV